MKKKCCGSNIQSFGWLILYTYTYLSLHKTTISDGPKEIALQPEHKSYTVSEMGSINTINCSASCRPDCRFVWKGPNMFEIQQFDLKFESILRNQSGIYVCYVSNIINSSMSQSISVIVNCKYE